MTNYLLFLYELVVGIIANKNYINFDYNKK